MRLWHIKLLPLLPRQQMLSQLRECVAIAKDIYETGKTNHILINPIMDYPIEEFQEYCNLVIAEMSGRGYVIKKETIEKFRLYLNYKPSIYNVDYDKEIFKDWHKTKYLVQCLYNLEEKYDRKGLTEDEWDKIYHKFYKYLDY